MSSLPTTRPVKAAALAAALGLVAVAATARPAHADAWIQFGVVGFAPPPPVVVAPSPPPPAYVYSYPYAYPYPAPYYAAQGYGYGPPVYVERGGWRERHWRHRDRDDDD